MAHTKQSNIYQVQDGPLKLEVPRSIRLVPESNSAVSNTINEHLREFKGYLTITNHGKTLVVYKVRHIQIMTRHNTKIWAKPSLGFTEPGETIILDISANNPFAPEANIEPSLLILATTCEVIEESKPTDLKSFWNGVKSIGSTAFVEVVETKLFFFSHTRYVPFGVKFELGGTDTEETTEWSSLSLSDSNSNFPDKEDTYSLVSSGSSLSDYEQHPFDLNENESLIPEESEKLAEDYSIPSTKDLELMPYTSKLTDKLFESHKSIRKIANCLFYVSLFLVIYYILYLMFIQKNFRKI